MPVATIAHLVPLSTQTHLDNTRLVKDHNDTGYGMLQAADGREIYFGFDVVDGCDFEQLWEGQQVEYEIDQEFADRAKRVAPVHGDVGLHRSGLRNPPAN